MVWPESTPEAEGLDGRALDRLARDLARSGTTGFLVARRGRVVAEWNAWRQGANEPQHLAALAKPVVGATAYLLGVEDGLFDLDTPGHRHVPEWRGDPRRSRIRVGHLITHSSGIENVNFHAGPRGELQGWQQRYWKDLRARFRMAAFEAPLLFDPGSQHRYSGVAYYAFAYLLGRALGPQGDVEALLRKRVYAPLGLPDSAWEIGYGKRFEVDGMTLHALGSGARFTPRALARVAELVRRRGEWEGQQLLDPAALSRLLAEDRARPPTSVDRGWWVNRWGLSRALPRDALVGSGGDHRLVVAMPDLELVALRLGDALEPDSEDPSQQFEVAERRFFEPLMRALSTEGGR